MIKDIPEEMIDSLSSSKIAAICQDNSIIPLKVTLQMLDLMVNEGRTPDNQQSNNLFTAAGKREIEAEENLLQDALERNQKAVKADDADIPEYLWDKLLVPSGNLEAVRALGHLTRLALRWWKNHVRKSFMRWCFSKHSALWRKLAALSQSYENWSVCLPAFLCTSFEAKNDWIAGRDCIGRCCNSSWWEWTDGSRPHFWR
jgi:hypothetical protein